MIHAALLKLVNLSEIVFTDMDDEHRGRWLDPCLCNNRIFRVVVEAVGMANYRLRALQIKTRKAIHLQDEAFEISDSAKNTVVPVLEELEELQLCLVDLWNTNPGPELHISKFLSHARNLTTLHIKGSTRGSGYALALIDWIIGISDQGEDKPVFCMPLLKELVLSHLSIDDGRLFRIVETLALSLRTFRLEKITLVREPSEGLPNGKSINLWAPFMAKIAGNPKIQLDEFKADRLRQRWSTMSYSEHVFFGAGRRRDHVGLRFLPWRFFIMRHALYMWVWRHKVPPNPESLSNLLSEYLPFYETLAELNMRGLRLLGHELHTPMEAQHFQFCNAQDQYAGQGGSCAAGPACGGGPPDWRHDGTASWQQRHEERLFTRSMTYTRR
ncbi:hypothetical protein E4U41_000408 [Claviceps citrina]|nr:hypothetical protein E4U41_000408 [Claviceps citrina]